MTTAAFRPADESTFCVTLIDWQGTLDAAHVLERFMNFFTDAGRSPSVWLASYAGREASLGGAAEVQAVIEEHAASCFELTLRHEREGLRGAWDVSCLFYDANNEHEKTKGLSCLQIAASSSLVRDAGLVAESMARFVAERAEFSYGYAFTAAYGLDLETYGPGLATSGAICPDLEDPYAWQKELVRAMSARTARPHHDGLLRFVYPRNFLGESLLRMRIDEMDLAAWIVSERMGRLTKLARNLWCWDLDEEQMQSARLALGRRGKLVAFKPRLERSGRRRLP